MYHAVPCHAILIHHIVPVHILIQRRITPKPATRIKRIGRGPDCSSIPLLASLSMFLFMACQPPALPPFQTIIITPSQTQLQYAETTNQPKLQSEKTNHDIIHQPKKQTHVPCYCRPLNFSICSCCRCWNLYVCVCLMQREENDGKRKTN